MRRGNGKMWDGRLDRDMGLVCPVRWRSIYDAFFERFAFEKMFANQPLIGSRTTLLTPSTHP